MFTTSLSAGVIFLRSPSVTQFHVLSSSGYESRQRAGFGPPKGRDDEGRCLALYFVGDRLSWHLACAILNLLHGTLWDYYKTPRLIYEGHRLKVGF